MDVVGKTIEIVGHNESGNSYTSINPTDVVSIGLFNWYGARALNIAREIVKIDPAGSQTALEGANRNLYSEIIGGNNNVWNNFRPGSNSADMSALKKFLGLDASKQAQDKQANVDAQGYISQAKARNITDEAAQVYFADLYNQSPRQAGNIVNAVKSNGLSFTLNNLHTYAMKNSVMNKYSTRRNWTYNQLVGWSGEEVITPPVNPPNQNGGDGTAGNLPPSASSVSNYVLFKKDHLIVYNSEYPQGNIFVKAGPNIFIPMTSSGG